MKDEQKIRFGVNFQIPETIRTNTTSFDPTRLADSYKSGKSEIRKTVGQSREA